jgi:hypothetical protein
MQKKTLYFLLPLILLFSACSNSGNFPPTPDASSTTLNSNPESQDTPTPDLTTTAIQATHSASDLLTPSSTSVLASPDPGVIIQPTSIPIPLILPELEIPEGEIQIYVPGELSRVTSPFRFVANLEPSPNYSVLIELIGEDGALLARKNIYALPPISTTRTNAITEIDFEIDGVAEAARLVVSVDDEYGRVRAVASVSLVLLSSGITQMNPYRDIFENIIIEQPSANFMVQGEKLIITGLARTQSDRFLSVELINREGEVVAFGIATMITPEGAEYGFFAAEIAYLVEEPIWVLVVVSETGDTILGTVHLSSIEMVISP